jgi:hypothetical protein
LNARHSNWAEAVNETEKIATRAENKKKDWKKENHWTTV